MDGIYGLSEMWGRKDRAEEGKESSWSDVEGIVDLGYYGTGGGRGDQEILSHETVDDGL